MSDLTCFKAYDVRGEIGVNIDEDIAYRIGRAVAQHFSAKSVAIGFDARETSPAFAAAASRGVRDAGSDVINIGMAGTEEMYWSVTEFGACAGIEVTASHNPIHYNGMKIVKSQSQPLEDLGDFQAIKALASSQAWSGVTGVGRELERSEAARKAYVERVLSFVNLPALRPLKIVVNSGNGAAGPSFDAIAARLQDSGVPLEFVRVHHAPDAAFPNGIPNPLLPENHSATADVVKAEKADFGVAFDGDFDRCFFFDENGRFIEGYYIVGLLAESFLEKDASAKIVHDPRLTWNTIDIVASKGGEAVQSKTGHAFIKGRMREEDATYGGEMSAHHYFKDFAYCDSGMVPWLLVIGLMSQQRATLSSLVNDRMKKFPASGEINRRLTNPQAAIDKIEEKYAVDALDVEHTDGLSVSYKDWRFNLRMSNTEPVVRLNVESRADTALMESKTAELLLQLGGEV